MDLERKLTTNPLKVEVAPASQPSGLTSRFFGSKITWSLAHTKPGIANLTSEGFRYE
jgi:hypothetical protein